jgi:hypothetical protein
MRVLSATASQWRGFERPLLGSLGGRHGRLQRRVRGRSWTRWLGARYPTTPSVHSAMCDKVHGYALAEGLKSNHAFSVAYDCLKVATVRKWNPEWHAVGSHLRPGFNNPTIIYHELCYYTDDVTYGRALAPATHYESQQHTPRE